MTTVTQCRAALAAANVGHDIRDEKVRRASRELYEKLAYARNQNEYTHTARIELGRDLVEEGRRAEGLAILRSLPASAGDFKVLADFFADRYEKTSNGQNKGK